MRAFVMSGFGSAKQGRVKEMPMPAIDDRHVLIKVTAAGVNPVDWKECEGHLEQFYGHYQPEWTPGYDAAGVVHAVGASVTRLKVGDRVVAFSDRRESGHNGTFAEYVRVLPNGVGIVPSSVDLLDAAAIPTAGLTGYQALTRSEKAGLRPGDSVLIHGASGGVGSYSVQLARARGLQVAASCSGRNVDYVRSLGADLVIDYSNRDIVAAVRRWKPQGVHAVIDCVSGGTLPDALDALRPSGRLISIATLVQDGDIAGETELAARRGFTKIFSIMSFDRIAEELEDIVEMSAKGQVKAPPIRVFTLDRAGEALDNLKNGGVRGKLVLTIDS